MKKIKNLDLKREAIRQMKVGTGLRTGAVHYPGTAVGSSGYSSQSDPPLTSNGLGTNGLNQGADDGGGGAAGGAPGGRGGYTYSHIRN